MTGDDFEAVLGIVACDRDIPNAVVSVVIRSLIPYVTVDGDE